MGPLSLSRSVELTAQWSEILTVGPMYPVALDGLHAVEGSGLGDFHRVVYDVHHRLSDFMHGIVVHRRMRLSGSVIGSGRTWYTRRSGFVRTWFPMLHLFSVNPIFLQVVQGCLLIPVGLTRNSERPGFPTFAVLGKGIPALRNSMRKSRGGYLCCLRLPRLTGQVLADVIQRKCATAGSLDV